MPITITAEQRDALYDDVLTHLSGLDGLWQAINTEDYDTADRLGREFTDDLRLIRNDLGWGDETDEPVELTLQSDVLRRVLTLLRDRAERYAHGEQAAALTEAREAQGQSLFVVEICDSVLAALPAPGGGR